MSFRSPFDIPHSNPAYKCPDCGEKFLTPNKLYAHKKKTGHRINMADLGEYIVDTNPRKKDTALKLFVWDGFAPDYTSGLAFAIAKNEEEARKMVIREHNDIDPTDWGILHVLPLTRKIAFAVSGGA